MWVFDPPGSRIEAAESKPMLSISAEEKRVALRAARSALVSYLNCGVVPELSTRSPALLEHRGSFVTLRRRDTGELRGCRGECRALRPLIESVIQQDPLFRDR